MFIINKRFIHMKKVILFFFFLKDLVKKGLIFPIVIVLALLGIGM